MYVYIYIYICICISGLGQLLRLGLGGLAVLRGHGLRGGR